MQRTADNIEANTYYETGTGAGAAAVARAAEEAEEGRRRMDEILREQRGVMHSLRQQGTKLNSIWEELTSRGRRFGGNPI